MDLERTGLSGPAGRAGWRGPIFAALLAACAACASEGDDGSGGVPREAVGTAFFSEDSCCADDSPCQDGLWCNGHETCNCWGECEVGAPINCDDGDRCTRDACDEETLGDNAGRCTHTRLSMPGCGCTTAAECDDTNPCTEDSCNIVSGVCGHTNLGAGTPCPDEGNVCTYDRCDGAGACAHPPTPSGTPCSDGLFCTYPDTCNGAGGCVGGAGTPCTSALMCPRGVCDPAAGTCTCTELWTDETHWLSGTRDGVSTNPVYPLHPDCVDPGTICLDSTMTTSRFIFIPNSASRTLAKLNVDTGAMEPGFPRSALGEAPSRTVVDPRDSSVWLGNRGWGNPWDGNRSNVVHFTADGTVVCRTPLPGMVRALVLDSNYDVWAGLWESQEIVKISGSITDPAAPYRTCRVLGRWSAGGRPYGAAGDAYGNVWFALNSNWGNSCDLGTQSLLRVPLINPPGRERIAPPCRSLGGCFNTYGIAVDGLGRVWIGSYACGAVFRYTPSSRTWSWISPGGNKARGLAFDASGTAYVALSHDNRWRDIDRVARIPPDMSTYSIINLGGSNRHPVGTAIDYAGRVWTVQRDSWRTACRVNVSAWPAYTVNCFSTGGGDPYAYTDMTGMQNRFFTSPSGTWTNNYDSGYPTARWTTVTWVAGNEIPGVTDVSIRARTAPTVGGLAGAVWSNRYTTSPANIGADPWMANPNQWVQVEVTLSTTDPRQTPVVYDLSVTWTR